MAELEKIFKGIIKELDVEIDNTDSCGYIGEIRISYERNEPTTKASYGGSYNSFLMVENPRKEFYIFASYHTEKGWKAITINIPTNNLDVLDRLNKEDNLQKNVLDYFSNNENIKEQEQNVDFITQVISPKSFDRLKGLIYNLFDLKS